MALEIANYIKELNSANPVGSQDSVSTLDDHVRLVKKTLIQSFPEVDGRVNLSSADMNHLKNNFKWDSVNGAWDVNNVALTNVASVDADSAVQPRSYNDARYLAAESIFEDTSLADRNTALYNLMLDLAPNASGVRLIANLMADILYPVGSVYSSTNSTNPASLFGVGTWQPYAQGRVLIGAGTGNDLTESNTFAVNQTGGKYRHKLTEGELPAHQHTLPVDSLGNQNMQSLKESDGNDEGLSATSKTGSAGSNMPHNNIQPYIVVYMFRRTA
jgi:hypothetical protein